MRKSSYLILVILIICITLTGCKGNDYKQALELQEAGEYTSALKIFETIPNYKDSSEKIVLCKTMIEAIDNFIKAKKNVENQTIELDKEIAEAEEIILAGEIAFDENLIPVLETAISEAKSVKYITPAMSTTAEEIVGQTAELNKVDYTEDLKNLIGKRLELEKSIKQYALVNAPSEGYIISCLKKVDNILDISAVTEENDPNGNLNKAGGYTSTVYCTSDFVDQSKVEGKTIIDKGTDGGVGIEVYTTSEDAYKRNDYLATFDGGIFATGSHTVVGTIVIRTSDLMTASNQKNMESAIVEQLIWIEE